jgi:hypothetical protein
MIRGLPTSLKVMFTGLNGATAMLDLALIGAVAGQVAARQQTDLAGLARLIDAYSLAYTLPGKVNKWWLWRVAERIEPCNTYGRYRTTPVTFANGGSSCHPSILPEVVDGWAHNTHWPVDARVRELGWIHPFSDGNGRLMWIVRTRLTDTWACPEPLPEYDYTPELK